MIKFNSVTKRFGDGTLAFNDLTFTIDSGEMVLITGPSGSGKTTLMNLLIRQSLPTRGEIYFEDNSIIELRRNDIPFYRRKIGVVFQDYKLLEEFNVWENIALPLYIAGKPQSQIDERVTDILNLIGLSDRAYSFPKQLSGGEAQRVGIGRALVTAPKVIFADEPTGNLDKEITQAIVSLLRKINQLGTTILVATHDQNVLDLLKDLKKVKLERSRDLIETEDDIGEEESKEIKDDDENNDAKKQKKKSGKKSRKDKKENKEVDNEDQNDDEIDKPKKKTRFRIDLPFLKNKKKVKEKIEDKESQEKTDDDKEKTSGETKKNIKDEKYQEDE